MHRVIVVLLSFLAVVPAFGAGEAAPQPRVAPGLYSPQAADTACKLLPVNADHLFVVAGVSQGDTLTNLQLGDPNGRSTAVRVKVAEGVQPLTVFLSSQGPVIWQFEGAVERVQRAIVASGSRDLRVAVGGLPADRVEFPELARCSRTIFAPWNVTDAQRDANFETHFGRWPDRAVYENKPNALALPEAAFAVTSKNAPRGIMIVRKDADGRTLRSVIEMDASGKMVERPLLDRRSDGDTDLLMYHSGGFRQIEAKSLVSPVEVLTPETFPGEAGLIQLENAGAIRPARRADIDAFVEGVSRPYRSKLSPDFRMHVSIDYVVTRDVMLPANLYGAHLKNFLVLPGVPAPRGNPGHGCLAFMDGFRMNDGAGCTGDMREPIDRLRRLPPPEALQACRLLEAAPDATLEAVSVYQPDGAKHSHGSVRVAAPIEVRVRKPGAVVLVLNTYEPAIWRVSFGPQTRIAGVVLTGYYASSVEGVHPDTPVVAADWQGRANRQPATPDCRPFLDYLGTAFRGGPAAMVLDRQVQALTGRALDGLRGAYNLKEVVIH